MKKILFLLMMFMAMNASAQTNITHKVDSLQQQVDKLTHEIRYLECSTQLKILNIELSCYVSDIKNAVDRILINVNRGYYFTRKEGEMMQMEYEACAYNLDEKKKLVNTYKWSISSTIENAGFYEHELDLLDSIFRAIESAINLAEINLKYYKAVVDTINDR